MYEEAGTGYSLMILAAPSTSGRLRVAWPCDCMVVNRIMDNMVRIRLNETNLVLLFEK